MATVMLLLLPWVRLTLALFLTLVFFALLREYETSERGYMKYAHPLRIGLTVALTLSSCTWGWPLIPFWLALALTGYLVLDPSTDDDDPMPEAPTKWLRFWQVLTGRRERMGIWSAYLETVILLLSIALYAYTLRNG